MNSQTNVRFRPASALLSALLATVVLLVPAQPGAGAARRSVQAFAEPAALDRDGRQDDARIEFFAEGFPNDKKPLQVELVATREVAATCFAHPANSRSQPSGPAVPVDQLKRSVSVTPTAEGRVTDSLELQTL